MKSPITVSIRRSSTVAGIVSPINKQVTDLQDLADVNLNKAHIIDQNIKALEDKIEAYKADKESLMVERSEALRIKDNLSGLLG